MDLKQPGQVKNSESYMTTSIEKWRAKTDVPFLVVAVASLPFLLLEVASNRLPGHDQFLLVVVNAFVAVVFLIDYAVELTFSADKRQYILHEWASLLIVLAQLLALLPALTALGALRFVKVIRVTIVLVRVLAISGSIAKMGKKVLRRRAASIGLTMAGFTWITSAVAFTLAEDVGDGRRIGSFFDAMWWSAATITTVGYGDIFPITAAGRLVGVATMIVGISTFALVTARIAQFLINTGEE